MESITILQQRRNWTQCTKNIRDKILWQLLAENDNYSSWKSKDNNTMSKISIVKQKKGLCGYKLTSIPNFKVLWRTWVMYKKLMCRYSKHVIASGFEYMRRVALHQLCRSLSRLQLEYILDRGHALDRFQRWWAWPTEEKLNGVSLYK